jgi:hypothetical protein
MYPPNSDTPMYLSLITFSRIRRAALPWLLSACALLLMAGDVPAGDVLTGDVLTGDVPKLQKVKVSDAVTVSIPAGFEPLTEAELNGSYFTYRLPLAVYRERNSQTDYGINEMPTQWAGDDLDILRKFFRATLLNTFTEVQMIRDEIRPAGKHQAVLFTFKGIIRPREDENEGVIALKPLTRYYAFQYLIYKGKVYIFQFNCPEAFRPQWEETAEAMLVSVRLR